MDNNYSKEFMDELNIKFKKLETFEQVRDFELELEKLGDYMKSNAYLERQARLKLNYKKPDEKVVFVYQNSNAKVQNKNVETEKILDSKLLVNLKEWWKFSF